MTPTTEAPAPAPTQLTIALQRAQADRVDPEARIARFNSAF